MNQKNKKLTDMGIKAAKFEDRNKPWRLKDEKNLYLWITKTGKLFRLDYRYGGKRKTLSFGAYPEIRLKDARKLRDDARRLIRDGVDPGEKKKADKARLYEKTMNTFEAVARRWFEGKAPGFAEATSTKMIRTLEKYIFPHLGKRPIADITPNELLSVLRKIEAMGYRSAPRYALQYSNKVFQHARRMGLIIYSPAIALSEELVPAKTEHRATTTDPQKIGGMLRAIDDYDGTPSVKCALQLAPLVFLRPKELRRAEWSEIDFDNSEWRIPGSKMKMKDDHIVPLAHQAIKIFESIEPITGHGRYVFQNLRSEDRPISKNTLLTALRCMGFTRDEICPHGFRGMASTILHGKGWRSKYIERQLAHAERNKVKAAYNHAQYLPERKEMMQSWADYLDTLKNGETNGK